VKLTVSVNEYDAFATGKDNEAVTEWVMETLKKMIEEKKWIRSK
jgi:hypothetical protein